MWLKAGAVSLALLLASRVLGLIRESAQAWAFGASGQADIAVLMLTLPDWITGLVVGGAMAYVMLPHWAAHSGVAQARSQRRVALRLGGLAVLLAGAVWAGRGVAVDWLASGLPAALRADATDALAWSALALLPAMLASLWVARLQFLRDFVGMYAANLVVNVVVIGGLLGIARSGAGHGSLGVLGAALSGAMLLRLAWLIWRLRKDPRPALNPAVPTATAAPLPAASIWIGAALSAGLPLALPFLARSIASREGEGALATFNYAWKLVELPLVLAVQLVATLAFPGVAKAFADGAAPGVALRRAFWLAWTLAAAAAAGLLLAAPAAAQWLFGWGRMSAADVARVADWGAAGAWGLLPQAVIAVALTALASLGRLRRTVAAYAIALGALLAYGAWSQDGRMLMHCLNLVLAGVAATVLIQVCTLVPGIGWRAMLPWRSMALSAGLVAVAAAAARAVQALVVAAAMPSLAASAALLAVAAAFAAALVGTAAWVERRETRSLPG